MAVALVAQPGGVPAPHQVDVRLKQHAAQDVQRTGHGKERTGFAVVHAQAPATPQIISHVRRDAVQRLTRPIPPDVVPRVQGMTGLAQRAHHRRRGVRLALAVAVMDRGSIVADGESRHDQVPELDRWTQRPGGTDEENGPHTAGNQIFDDAGQRGAAHGWDKHREIQAIKCATLHHPSRSVGVVLWGEPCRVFQITQRLQPIHDRFGKGQHSQARKRQPFIVQATISGSGQRLLSGDEKGIG
jgi:hypothetical protein